MLHQQARRATEIVQNLMYFSRPPAPGKTPVNLSELVTRTLHLHAYSLRKNNITVDFLPEESLPQITGDPHQLMQVFLNLMLNAEQAIREARDKGTLRIRLRKTDGHIQVSFEDDGPGIAPEILPNIFDPFYTTRRPGRGTGLGLSICKAVLKEHFGNIEADLRSRRWRGLHSVAADPAAILTCLYTDRLMQVLEGQTALVTGASRGIGRAVSLHLARAGADVILHYNTNKEAAEAVAGEMGQPSLIVQADLRSPQEIDRLVRSLGDTKIDILVNNAGLWGPTALGSTKLETLESMLDVNVKAVFWLTQALLPLLRDGARIVNVSSIAGRIGTGRRAQRLRREQSGDRCLHP